MLPITAKLSRAFYDRFGDAVVDELVDWLNQMDAASHGSLRELNEFNFARFEAKLEQRTAAKIDQVDFKIDHVAATLHAKIDHVAAMLHARVDECATKVQVEQLRAAMVEMHVGIRSEMVVQFRWMIGLWFTMCLALIGLLYRH